MLSRYKRKWIPVLLAFLLSVFHVSGRQFSLKNGTALHLFPALHNEGMLATSQCVIFLLVEWAILSVVFYAVFQLLSHRGRRPGAGALEISDKEPKHLWLYASIILYAVYLLYLVGCYPGFYCYDMGNQLPQIMYPEVPFDAHHPLLHTIVGGGLITLGYRLYSTDLTFGIFLYHVAQMGICAICFGYAVRFVYRVARKRFFAVLAMLFYLLCPPIVIFAMTTTKDVSCYAFFLAACIKEYGLCQSLGKGMEIKKSQWVWTGILLVLACLLRNNNIYALLVFAVIQMILYRKQLYRLLLFYLCTIALFFGIQNGAIFALDAEKGSIAEALSVPFQQMARVYAEYGEDAFSEEELRLLYDAIEPSMLETYDPMISDSVKYAFWRHLDTIMDKKWEYLSLWLRKGREFPICYLMSFAENTYQTWYPWTELRDTHIYRYFDFTELMKEYSRPKCQWLYDFIMGLLEREYIRVPILRMSFSIGAMFWFLLITFFYGLWQRNRSAAVMLLLVLLVCATCLCGPVSDLRYYLILFYLFPVEAALLLQPQGEKGV